MPAPPAGVRRGNAEHADSREPACMNDAMSTVALDAVFAGVASEGGSARTLEHVAREAARAAGGSAAIVRFDGEAWSPLAVWPDGSHAAWPADLSAGWHTRLVSTPGLQRVGPAHVAAAVLVEGRPWGALVAWVAGAPDRLAEAAPQVLDRLAGLVAFGVAGRPTPCLAR